MNGASTLLAENGAKNGLSRFHEAQAMVWPRPLVELRQGVKRGHWMWFVFPQVAGLGMSAMSELYAIRDMREARDYLRDEVLNERLGDGVDAVQGWAGERSIGAIFGGIDAVKFGSSMTLFEAAGGGRRYSRALDSFFGGRRDTRTLDLIA